MSGNYHLVEGPFKNFTVRRVRPQDIDKVTQHIKDYFLHDEPTSQLLGYSEEFGEEFCTMFRYFLPDNLSFWAEHNETGEVAAVRSTFIHKPSDDCWNHFPRKTRASQVLYQMADIAIEKAQIYERFGIETYAEFLIASCSPKYRKQGITTELYKRSIAFLDAEGFKLVESIFTSQWARKVVEDLGFKELSRVYYKDLRDDNGQIIFDSDKLNSEHFGALMVKLI